MAWHGYEGRLGRPDQRRLPGQRLALPTLHLHKFKGHNMTKTITRVYSDYAAAELAVRELKAAGLGDSHIGIVASNADGWHKPGGGDVDPKHDKDRDGKDDRAEGAATGGGMGAIAGGAAGVAAGLGMIAIPGIGPVVAAGWLAALAAGAVGGGAAGGIIGA